ncbi:TetR/AcrR family transcriptional regulator [Fibrella aquatica]|uniref:TetR/AcrR family transcriptional regulator n=1 Tax=Fibrella aquatica TaxID=3242487 RepID=UPI0035228C7B
MKERILTEASRLFNHLGVKTVRLDDIARQLGMSKKTLYQYFESKEDLVKQMLENQLNDSLDEASAIQEQTANPIAGALLIWDRLIHYKQTVNPNLLRDIERHYPAAWHYFQTFRTHYINTILVGNLRAGVERALYRPDLADNESVMAWLWLEQSQCDIPFEGAGPIIKHQFVRGLLTKQGLALYETIG